MTSVDYSEDRVNVRTFGGSELAADYIIVTLPLYLLRKEVIKFTPSLPVKKTEAVEKMGTGVLEKVCMFAAITCKKFSRGIIHS